MRLLLILLLLPSLLFAQPVPPPAIAAKSYLLYDFNSRQTLASHNPEQRIEPASLTKLMTAYLSFSALKRKDLKPDQQLPVSERAWRAEGSRMFIDLKKPVTVDELLHGMIIQSGNDASIALAEAIAGSEDLFAQLMNKEAQRQGMKNTHFVNATGLPHPQHYTTAADLALLAAAIVRDFPEYYPYYSIKEYSYNDIVQKNRNQLLWKDPYVDGIKTGHTESAGFCMIASAKRNERRLISVVLGTASEDARALESQKLLNYGFQFYDAVKMYQKGQAVATLAVWKGSSSELAAGFERDFYVSVPKGEAPQLKASLESQRPLLAPISAGQKVGTLKLTLNDKPYAEYPIVALENVGIGNILKRGWDNLRLLFK